MPSSFVRDSFVKSGIATQSVQVIPNGVNIDQFRPEATAYDLKADRTFRFLFVGGTIWRKGPDVLLSAYLSAFTAQDDVCLVIKDMGGQSIYKGQTFSEKIKKCCENKNMPSIAYLDADIPPEAMPGLYTACQCLVHPFRGEGFGLPIAEAMACALPVIVTGYGPVFDYCDDDNAYFIQAEVRRFSEKKIGSLNTVDFPWYAEPDRNDLIRLLRHVYTHRDKAAQKGGAGRIYVESHLAWKHVAEKVIHRISRLKERPIRRLSKSPGSPAQQCPSQSPSEPPAFSNAIEAQIDKARRLCEMDRFNEAWGLLRDLMARAADQKQVRLTFAELLIQRRKYNEAAEILNRISSRQADTSALLLQSQCHLACGQIMEARRCLAHIPDTDAESAAVKVIQGRVAVAEGEPAVAQTLFQQAIRTDPGQGEAYAELGSLKWADGHHAGAFDLFLQGFGCSPAHGDIADRLHRAAVSLGELTRAAEAFRQKVVVHPHNRRLRCLYIDLLLHQEKFETADAEIASAIRVLGQDKILSDVAVEVKTKISESRKTETKPQ
ncbi:MAG: tetratricopeptide repeat protein [Desulfatitalea sp.]|nr:tetratricopeptide repeat protein [Desulfatitalea sp.]